MADEASRVVKFERRTATRTIAELGQCQVRAPSAHLELGLAKYYRRPWQTPIRHFVNALLAGCIEGVTPSEIDHLSERGRAQLRRAAAEAADAQRHLAQLDGCHLNGDERLFAVMLWRYRRLMEELSEVAIAVGRRALRGLRGVSRLVDSRPHPRGPALPGRPALGALAKQTRVGDVLSGAGLASSPMRNLTASLAKAVGVNRSFLRRAMPASLLRAAAPPALPTKVLGASDPMLRINRALGSTPLTSPALSRRHERFLPLRPTTPRWTTGALLGHDLTRALRQLSWPRGVAELLDSLSRAPGYPRTLQEAQLFMRQWEDSALWFLLALLTAGKTRGLVGLSRQEIEQALLQALEGVVTERAFINALQGEVERAPHLTDAQRRHLTHALDHAGAGEWVDACPPLLSGLEGAFWAAAREIGVITPDRALVHRPSKTATSVEALFKLLPLPRAYRTFLLHLVFGGGGNPFRHGDAQGGERERVLLGTAALVGWLQSFAADGPHLVLGEHLRAQLPQAIH